MKLIVGNWKMNPSNLAQAKRLFSLVAKGVKNLKGVRVIICPPFLYLPYFSSKNHLFLGAQNCFWEKTGAFTGEISPLMLKSLKVKYVILGHSERRRIFSETDVMVAKKIKTALDLKLKPIFCIGENLKERETGKTKIVLKKQLKGALSELKKEKLNQVILAYEPVWAIGSGYPCDAEEAKEILLFLRKFFKNKILYGGSVNSQNTRFYLEAGFDGLLIGGASLKAQEFIKIIKIASPKQLKS